MAERGIFKRIIAPVAALAVASVGGGVVGSEMTRNNLTRPSITTPAEAQPAGPSTTVPARAEHLAGVESALKFTITGVADKVDGSKMDVAKGQFVNTIGLGTQYFVATPGHLNVGPDYLFDQPGRTIQEIDAKLEAAKGAVEYFNPVNQMVFETDGPSYVNNAEGEYVFASAAHMKLTVNGKTFDLDAPTGSNWFAIIRSKNSDGKQNTDRNSTIKFEQYVPGHIEVERYGNGKGGFISEGQLKQKAATSHTGGSNSGADGASELYVLMYDENTDGYTVIKQTVNQGQSTDAPWTLVKTNIAA